MRGNDMGDNPARSTRRGAGVRISRVMLATAVAATAAVVGLPGAASAGGPAPIDPARLPADGNPAPPDKTEAANACTIAVSTTSPAIPPAQAYLNLPAAWQFSRGEGQTVAVIDTGVSRHPRLPDLIAGGDYVATSDGTDDCDVHGTAVAGLIAAHPSASDGFSGIAPAARIIAIRQTSANWRKQGATDQDPNNPKNSAGYGTVTTLASAVRHAADMGATVINISETACGPAGSVNDGSLGAAVQYAALVKDVVVVAAAGNNDSENCKAGNPGVDPIHPNADLWSTVTTAVTPAWYDRYVLAVGSIDLDGAPSKFTVPGPWVGVAAPGEQIISLDPHSGGLASGKVVSQGQGSFAGTSFASPYVAGLAALVRARFPQLSAAEVIQRIKATAHTPAEGWNPWIGHGSIDPIAALTHEVATDTVVENKPLPTDGHVQLPVPVPPPPPDNSARTVALVGSGIVGVLLILGFAASFPLTRLMRDRADDI
ncbi:type VII secretion-associated serine protease mycosin (plasmid) [Nocardia sp. CA-084685]|uniref:type VII secretion-associated serine protease mycosin n=1 Tax=Nocardia sp. CA-084685 TaxID=3239970 RepID=UPI003D989463